MRSSALDPTICIRNATSELGCSIPIRLTPLSITSSRSIIDCSGRVCNTASRSSAGYGAAICCGIDCCATSHCALSGCGASCGAAMCCAIDCCATSRCGTVRGATNHSTAGCSACAWLQPLSNQHSKPLDPFFTPPY